MTREAIARMVEFCKHHAARTEELVALVSRLNLEVSAPVAPQGEWVMVPERFVIAVNEFLGDWKKGDFSLSTLAALDAQSIIEAKEAWAERLAASPPPVADAVMAEREACAKIAADIPARPPKDCPPEYREGFQDGCDAQGEIIAAAIRARSEP